MVLDRFRGGNRLKLLLVVVEHLLHWVVFNDFSTTANVVLQRRVVNGLTEFMKVWLRSLLEGSGCWWRRSPEQCAFKHVWWIAFQKGLCLLILCLSVFVQFFYLCFVFRARVRVYFIDLYDFWVLTVLIQCIVLASVSKIKVSKNALIL